MQSRTSETGILNRGLIRDFKNIAAAGQLYYIIILLYSMHNGKGVYRVRVYTYSYIYYGIRGRRAVETSVVYSSRFMR